MRLHVLCFGACLSLLSMIGVAGLHAQGAAEYGMTTTVPATAAAASGKAMVPFPKVTLPGDGSSSTSSGAAPGLTSAGPTVAPESIAKDNLQFFQGHAGTDAAALTVHSVPDHASVWIDGKYVGPAPVNLKLAPGHHQALVRAPNMQESAQNFDVAAKQAQSLDFALKPSFQNQVMIQWPSQKK
jgi:hypothetical protein